MKYSYIVAYDEAKSDWEVWYDNSRDLDLVPGYDPVKDSVLCETLRNCVPGIVPGL